jgi:hypothetical protein
MSQVLDWLKGAKNRAAVVINGGGLMAIVCGGWTVATFPIDHHMDQPSPSSSILAEQKGIAIASDQDIRINAPVASNPNAKDNTSPILEQIERLEGRQKETVSQIARKKGIASPPLLAVLVKMGEKGVKIADIPNLLDAKANELIKLRSKTDRLREGRAELAGIAQEVQSLIDKGELDAASKVLARAREAARTQRINASRDAAEILALDARIDDLQLAYRLAASKDGEAAILVAPFDSVMRQGLLRKQASELYNWGIMEHSPNPSISIACC